LHNWKEYGGQIVDRRERHRQVMARVRSGHVPVTEESRDGNVTHNSTVQTVQTGQDSGDAHTRQDEGPERHTRKNPGTIRSDADLSHWNQGKPEPLDPETSAALEAAIGKGGGVKPLPGPGPGRREKLHRQAVGADRDE